MFNQMILIFILGSLITTFFSSYLVVNKMQILIPQSLRDYAQLKVKEKVSLIGMGQKFEVWNEKNWLAKEKGQQIQGEKLDIDLPSNVQEIPF